MRFSGTGTEFKKFMHLIKKIFENLFSFLVSVESEKDKNIRIHDCWIINTKTTFGSKELNMMHRRMCWRVF